MALVLGLLMGVFACLAMFYAWFSMHHDENIPSACNRNCNQGRQCSCQPLRQEFTLDAPLPSDYSRCSPTDPDAFCRNCKRWMQLPGQTITEQTIVFTHPLNSLDSSCRYISANNGVRK